MSILPHRDIPDAVLAHDMEVINRIDAVPTILNVICSTTNMGFAAVARVTDSRWIACAVRDDIRFGLLVGDELPVQTTICHEIHESQEPVVIEHVATDALYHDHVTPRIYGFQSYISMPIFDAQGRFFGTLCAIDPNPRQLNTPAVRGMFRLFADLIGFHLDAQYRLEASDVALREAKRVGELREQFIAVLGHDLRNPLSAIRTGAEILARRGLDDQLAKTVSRMQRSAQRMAELIDDVLDFARGRLGEGLQIECRADDGLAAEVEQVIGELRLAWPDRRIETRVALGGPIWCDRRRIGQLLSNLLANALAHGAADEPVRVDIALEDGVFVLAVANGGPPLPPELVCRLFEPYIRAGEGSGRQGLGLGLYIVREIAKEHGGTVDVVSIPNETRFTLRMPARAPAA